MGEIDYIVSDGYDVAQTAICFLYQFVSHSVYEIYGKDRNGKEITIKLASYREVDHFINLLRNISDRRGTIVESIDFTDYKAPPMDPVNCFEHEQTDYTKYDELIGALQLLSAFELTITTFTAHSNMPFILTFRRRYTTPALFYVFSLGKIHLILDLLFTNYGNAIAKANLHLPKMVQRITATIGTMIRTA